MNVAHYFGEFMPQIVIIALVYMIVLVTIFLDLAAGVRKAKQRGEYRSSTGLRKTVDKIGRYFNMLFAVTATDAIQMLAIVMLNHQTNSILPVLPFLTIVGALFACIIEIKSIYENNSAKEKAKVQETAKMLSEILKNKDNQEIFGAFVEYMKREKPNTPENNQ